MRILCLLAVVLVAATGATAQPNPAVTGSVLLFPCYDASTPGVVSLISVTNTNDSRKMPPNGRYRFGDVNLHYFYVDSNCRVLNRFEKMTPADMLTVDAASHSITNDRGYLIVIAVDPESGQNINYNYLAGDSLIVDLAGNALWSLPAIAFRALATGPAKDRNGRSYTDSPTNGGNGNGAVDFDGKEYDLYPDELFINSFMEESLPVEGYVYLVSGLKGDFDVQLNLLIYNNNENVYSAGHKFRCWDAVKLSDMTRVVKNLGGTSTEIPTGWMKIDGSIAIHVISGRPWRNEVPNGTDFDPPVIGAFAQRITLNGLTTGRILNMRGTQNGNDFPWDGNN